VARLSTYSRRTWKCITLSSPIQILFSLEAPEGDRGCEGCQVVDIEPERRLTFTWNSPPSIPTLRFERTNVIVELAPAGDATTVRLLAFGWGAGEQWQASYAYFDRAWDTVLGWLVASFSDPPPTARP
jgi:uncharacterized protein YndB with AHSA1/START domain